MARRGWLPALVNAGRAFVTIGAIALFWIVTAWPGCGDATTYAAIVVVLFAPLAEQPYGAVLLFIVGTLVDVVLTAVVSFGVLPELGIERFARFSLVLAVCLVPMGVLLAQAHRAWSNEHSSPRGYSWGNTHLASGGQRPPFGVGRRASNLVLTAADEVAVLFEVVVIRCVLGTELLTSRSSTLRSDRGLGHPSAP